MPFSVMISILAVINRILSVQKRYLIGSAIGVGLGRTSAAIIGETPLVIGICVGIGVGFSLIIINMIFPPDEYES